ncbi:MAG: 2-amino-4-hydroxy-6-hydroxymethyldihydropteridine diphosphokinase [bacterium]
MNVFLSLGSNSGDRERYLKKAVKAINNLEDTEVLKSSSIYETDPWGNKNLDLFLNQVIMIDTELDCVDLLEECRNIEKQNGRIEEIGKWKARTLDIDILLCDNRQISMDKLQVPHPLLAKRMFVLKPLSELDPNLIFPGKNQKVVEVMQECNDTSKVRLYKK